MARRCRCRCRCPGDDDKSWWCDLTRVTQQTSHGWHSTPRYGRGGRLRLRPALAVHRFARALATFAVLLVVVVTTRQPVAAAGEGSHHHSGVQTAHAAGSSVSHRHNLTPLEKERLENKQSENDEDTTKDPLAPLWTLALPEHQRKPNAPKPDPKGMATAFKNIKRTRAPPPPPPLPPPNPYPPPQPPLPWAPPPPPLPQTPAATQGAGISGTYSRSDLEGVYAQYREARAQCAWGELDQGSKAAYEVWATPTVWAAGKHAALFAESIRGEVKEYDEFGFSNTTDYIKKPESPYNLIEARACLIEDVTAEPDARIKNGRPGSSLTRVNRPTWGITRVGPFVSTGGGQWHKLSHVFNVGMLRQWTAQAAETAGRITAIYMNPVRIPKTEVGPGGLTVGGHGSTEDAKFTHYVENPPLSMHECKLYDGAGRRGGHLLASWGPAASCAQEDGGHACSMRVLPDGVGLDVRGDSGGVKLEECYIMDMREPDAEQLVWYLEIAFRVEPIWLQKYTKGRASIGGTNLVFTNPPNEATAPYGGVVTPSGSRLNPTGPAVRRPIWPSLFRNPDPYSATELADGNADGNGKRRSGFWRDQSVLGKSLAPSVYWYSAPLKLPPEGSTLRNFHPHAFDPHLVVSVMLFLAKPVELGLPWNSHEVLNVTDSLRFNETQMESLKDVEYFGHPNEEHMEENDINKAPALDGEPMLYDRFRTDSAHEVLGLGDTGEFLPKKKKEKAVLRAMRETAADWGVAEYVALAPVDGRKGQKKAARRRGLRVHDWNVETSRTREHSRSPSDAGKNIGWARDKMNPGEKKEAQAPRVSSTTSTTTTTTTTIEPGVNPQDNWDDVRDHEYHEAGKVNLDETHFDESRHNAAYSSARKKLLHWLDRWQKSVWTNTPPPPPHAPPPTPPPLEGWEMETTAAPLPVKPPPSYIPPSDGPKLLCEWWPTFEKIKGKGGGRKMYPRSFQVANNATCGAARARSGDHLTVVAFLRPRPRKEHEEAARASGLQPPLSSMIEPGRWVNEISMHVLVHPNRVRDPKGKVGGGYVAPGLCLTRGACS